MNVKQQKSDLYFEEIDSQFDQWMSLYDVEQRITLIKKFLPEGISDMVCLEVGCSTGKISEAIAPLLGKLLVADISETLAQKVGTRLGIDWTRQNACDLDFPENTFDLVISSECIEHTADPRQALSEMARVLKNTGTIIITSPNKLWYPLVWIAMNTHIRKFSGNEHWLFPWEACNVLAKNHIAEIQTGGCHLLPWQIPLIKHVLPLFDRVGHWLYPFMINYGLCGKKRTHNA